MIDEFDLYYRGKLVVTKVQGEPMQVVDPKLHQEFFQEIDRRLANLPEAKRAFMDKWGYVDIDFRED